MSVSDAAPVSADRAREIIVSASVHMSPSKFIDAVLPVLTGGLVAISDVADERGMRMALETLRKAAKEVRPWTDRA